jgi:hypothetical protein
MVKNRVTKVTSGSIMDRRSSWVRSKTWVWVHLVLSACGERNDTFLARAAALAYLESLGGVVRLAVSFDTTPDQSAASIRCRSKRGLGGGDNGDDAALNFPAASARLCRSSPAIAMTSAAPPPKQSTLTGASPPSPSNCSTHRLSPCLSHTCSNTFACTNA